MKIIFVCTGNSCRSPMAEALARKIFAEKGIDCEVQSGGVSVLLALPPSENALEVMKGYGIDISEYRTKQITAADMEAADLILTMTIRHKRYLDLQLPKYSDKVFTLNLYAGVGDKDVDDPFGGSVAKYRNCAKELETAIEALVKKLQMPKGGIALGCDHGGYALMQEVIAYLEKSKQLYTNFGTYNTDAADYPIYAKNVAEAILSGQCQKGILICGTGIGISIAANRHKGIRAALCHDVFSARATREHNDSNILCMGGRIIGVGHALEVVKAFLETEFSNEQRHMNRIGQIENQS